MYRFYNLILCMVRAVAGGGRGRIIPQITEGAEDAAHIVVVFDNHDPVDLLDFTASLSGLAREHEALLRSQRPGIDVDETRLLVVDVRRGSILIELLPVLAPFVSTMEFTNTAANFVKHIAAFVGIMSVPGGRIPDATTAQLKNLNDTVKSVVNDSNGSLDISARYKNGKVVQELIIQRAEAVVIEANVAAQRKEIENKGSATHKKVLMRLHQSSVESLKIEKRTSEKGIVESIDMAPHTLVYVSDSAGHKIKDEILKDGNPFQKGFVVDLDVETVGGRPKVYRIMEVHEVIDLDD